MVAGAQVLAQAEVDNVDGRSVSGREDCCKPVTPPFNSFIRLRMCCTSFVDHIIVIPE